ncbi:MAG: protein-L-isoaspartate(D-aspartate) O-methyltransferase [Cyclobacteriaceae bacterium]|nr:protein-L-isoaspartate(D-aspartate) O-methyltransferase [Cyclobacteriaceae bacterium]MCK5467709.1 protein-L-isoaspartate(D-aspartate) O-methyltransferase [Cyclobacteriaceae bacterium]
MLEDNYRHRGMRRNLVKVLINKGIKDEAVLKAIQTVPRHYFFDKAFLEHAYQDKAFPIGEGQTISQPYTVAIQTQLLKIKPGDKVLEIGTGSGYQCCVLLEMQAKVFTIEFNKRLYMEAKSFLHKLGYRAHFHLGDGSQGWPTFAPYDKIIVTAGAPDLPQALIDQLKSNGKLVIPIGGEDHQEMIRISKDTNGKIRSESHDFFRFVPLVGKYGWKEK